MTCSRYRMASWIVQAAFGPRVGQKSLSLTNGPLRVAETDYRDEPLRVEVVPTSRGPERREGPGDGSEGVCQTLQKCPCV